MGFLFGSPPKSTPPPAVPQPKQEDRAMENAANAERLRRIAAFGRQDTQVAGDLGKAAIIRKTLLGE